MVRKRHENDHSGCFSSKRLKVKEKALTKIEVNRNIRLVPSGGQWSGSSVG